MYCKSLLVISFLLFTIFPSLAQNGHPYVGTATCGMCHKTEKQGEQLKIWQGSAHAGAYETLKTAEADKIAKEKGYDTKAIETEDCLKCHAVGYNLDASMLGRNLKLRMEFSVKLAMGQVPVIRRKVL